MQTINCAVADGAAVSETATNHNETTRTDAKRKPVGRQKKNAEDKTAPTPKNEQDAPSKTASAQNAAERDKPRELTEEELTRLQDAEKEISSARKHAETGFAAIAKAMYAVREGKLYRKDFASFHAYASQKWGYSRSHANRLADAGKMIEELSPLGDTIKKFTSESHMRPLSALPPQERQQVLAVIEKWEEWRADLPITPHLVESAVAQIRTPAGPRDEDENENAQLEKVRKILNEGESNLPEDTTPEVKQVIVQIRKKVTALFKLHRSSGIDWTEATWNPLQGCTRASKGCDYCYAAKLVATRLADVYPGLAKEKMTADGKKYVFTGKLLLLPETLGVPLRDRIPKRWFVNSMSDLFHPDVPDAYIAAVFDVMERAHWHQFQVLTKRPERMAEWTTKRYAGKEPPANVWLGTTTEDQEAFDKRLPHLLKTKAAIRWLSVEPLIGAIKMEKLDGIDWVVVGGESGSNRKMDIEWVRAIRDVCEVQGIAFFFKQWGDYGPDGKKLKKVKKDGLTPPPLDGVPHDAYPLLTAPQQDDAAEPEVKTSPKKSKATAKK